MVVGVCYASLMDEKIIVFKTPTEMVHVTDPLVKSQLFNIWVLASEVVITAVSRWLRAGEGNMNRTFSGGVVDNNYPSWGWALVTNSLSTALLHLHISNVCFLTLKKFLDGVT